MLTSVVASLLLSAAPAMEDDQLPAAFLQTVKAHSTYGNSLADGSGVLGRKSSGSVLGVDSVVNWSSYFYQADFFAYQFTWPYTMVGKPPFGQPDSDGKTVIRAPVVAVNVDLRNYDGSPRYVNGQRLYSDATQYVTPVLQSPVFANAWYDSSERPTQFTDAIQRAEFYRASDDGWHTLLQPSVPSAQTMVLVRGTYRFALNADGSCCFYILVDANAFGAALFPATPSDTTTPIGAAENAGDITTHDIATFLFPNTYLYIGTTANCCILGYHTYDTEPGDSGNGWRERRYVLNYSSWISPGLFGAGFTDVTALSHEMAETFNDPFVNNATPWWLAPNFNCQNNLETGDVIEGLPNATYPITMKNGFTYHPQNEALLQWFAGQTPSSAIHHAYSYPDTTVLPTAAVVQPANCNPPQ